MYSIFTKLAKEVDKNYSKTLPSLTAAILAHFFSKMHGNYSIFSQKLSFYINLKYFETDTREIDKF